MNFKHKALYTFFAVTISTAGFWGLDRAVHKVMHGFTIHDLYLDVPADIIAADPPSDLNTLLDQPFDFFSYGGESYIFVSKDQKWVLKVFKNHRLSAYKQLSFLKNLPGVNDLLSKRADSYERFWNSFKAQQSSDLHSLSLIHYSHIPHGIGPLKVTLIDPIHITHSVDLSKIPFILQKKGHLFAQVFDQAPTFKKKKELLVKAIDFYEKLYRKGFKLWDMAPKRNLGFFDKEAFIIDSGSVCPLDGNETFFECTKKFEKWVNKFHPKFLHFVQTEIKKRFNNERDPKPLLPLCQSQEPLE